jgi:hypothetical protein
MQHAAQNAMTITLERWHGMVHARDFSRLIELMEPQAIFRSPIAHTPYQGAEAVSRILDAALHSFTDFEYLRSFSMDDQNIALEFQAKVDDKAVKGIDLIRFSESGQIAEFEVMLRPMSGLARLAEHMKAKVGPYLASLG